MCKKKFQDLFSLLGRDFLMGSTVKMTLKITVWLKSVALRDVAGSLFPILQTSFVCKRVSLSTKRFRYFTVYLAEKIKTLFEEAPFPGFSIPLLLPCQATHPLSFPRDVVSCALEDFEIEARREMLCEKWSGLFILSSKTWTVVLRCLCMSLLWFQLKH